MRFDFGSSIGIARHACALYARPRDDAAGKVYVAMDTAGPVEVLDRAFFRQVCL